jgi:hypothetical protein
MHNHKVNIYMTSSLSIINLWLYPIQVMYLMAAVVVDPAKLRLLAETPESAKSRVREGFEEHVSFDTPPPKIIICSWFWADFATNIKNSSPATLPSFLPHFPQ